jgi:histidinol-phosphate aminotransferase
MIDQLIKKSLRNFKPYKSARSIYKSGGNGIKNRIFLDANENPFDTGFNRYPSPDYIGLRLALGNYASVPAENVFVGNGSDEALSLICRLVLEPGKKAIGFTPSYGMYPVETALNGAKFIEIPLKEDPKDGNFGIDEKRLYKAITPAVKIIFICSPNNPTGNIFPCDQILKLCKKFKGLVIVDEAYIEFSSTKSMANEVFEYPNLIVLRTLSKAWGLAGARVGYAIADSKIIGYLNAIKLPYNLSSVSEKIALDALCNKKKMTAFVKKILIQKEILKKRLPKLGLYVYPSETNFLFIRYKNSEELVSRLAQNTGIIIRAFPQGFRVTVGKPEENEYLIKSLTKFL